MKAKDYISLPYRRVIIPCKEGGFAISLDEFPGCVSQGETLQGAWDALDEAMEGWIESCLEIGQDIPPPRGEL